MSDFIWPAGGCIYPAKNVGFWKDRGMCELVVGHTADLDGASLAAACALLFDVFDDMTDEDWERPDEAA
jgi:hypothetical protein